MPGLTWIIIGIVLLLVDQLVKSSFIRFFAVAALAVGVLRFLFLNSLVLELVLFVIIAGFALVFLQNLLRRS